MERLVGVDYTPTQWGKAAEGTFLDTPVYA